MPKGDTMNLIGNCCISSYLLRLYGYGNTNPFAWIYLDFESFYRLLTEWDSINWMSLYVASIPHPHNNGQKAFELTIGQKVKLTFIHILPDPNCTVPTRRGADIYCSKPYDYIIKKYAERLGTMLNAKQLPMFVHEWEHLDYNESAFQKLLDTDLKYKVVAITNNQKLKDVKKENLLVIYDPSGKGPGPGNHLPWWYATTYKNVIKNFLVG